MKLIVGLVTFKIVKWSFIRWLSVILSNDNGLSLYEVFCNIVEGPRCMMSGVKYRVTGEVIFYGDGDDGEITTIIDSNATIVSSK